MCTEYDSKDEVDNGDVDDREEILSQRSSGLERNQSLPEARVTTGREERESGRRGRKKEKKKRIGSKLIA